MTAALYRQQYISIYTVFGIAVALSLAACTQAVVPTKPAADWMMAKPKPLPDAAQLKGADYKVLYVDLRSDAATEKAQLRALQKRERTLTGK